MQSSEKQTNDDTLLKTIWRGGRLSYLVRNRNHGQYSNKFYLSRGHLLSHAWLGAGAIFRCWWLACRKTPISGWSADSLKKKKQIPQTGCLNLSTKLLFIEDVCHVQPQWHSFTSRMCSLSLLLSHFIFFHTVFPSMHDCPGLTQWQTILQLKFLNFNGAFSFVKKFV